MLAVGSADPVGLARLVRGLAELREAVPDRSPPQVVVNRVRRSAVPGDAAQEVRGALARYAGVAEPVLVPYDLAALDGALAGGRTLAEAAPGSPARAALLALARDLAGPGAGEPAARPPAAACSAAAEGVLRRTSGPRGDLPARISSAGGPARDPPGEVRRGRTSGAFGVAATAERLVCRQRRATGLSTSLRADKRGLSGLLSAGRTSPPRAPRAQGGPARATSPRGSRPRAVLREICPGRCGCGRTSRAGRRSCPLAATCAGAPVRRCGQTSGARGALVCGARAPRRVPASASLRGRPPREDLVREHSHARSAPGSGCGRTRGPPSPLSARSRADPP